MSCLELGEGLVDGVVDASRGALGVDVGAAARLLDHAVDDAQRQKLRGRRPQRLGGLRGELGVAPQDGGAALGRDHRVGRVLLHEDAVGDGEGEGSARAALADQRGHDRHAQAGHGQHGLGDGARLPALFGGHARIGPRRVDEGEHGQAVAFGQGEQPLGLAVALGLGHPEAVLGLLVERAALLVADHDHGAPVEPAQPADHGPVVGPQAVALELLETVDQELDVLAGARTVLVARDLDGQPGIVAAALMPAALQETLESLRLLREVHSRDS